MEQNMELQGIWLCFTSAIKEIYSILAKSRIESSIHHQICPCIQVKV